MVLSIVIPQYRETDRDVKRLLSSIDWQLNVDWNEIEVIIVNDGSDTKLSTKMLESFDNIKPKYIQLEKNVGPGLARQAGFDASQGEYVTFCDADDMYHNFGVLSLYIDEIKKKQPDIIQTQWIEEVKINQPDNPEMNGKLVYVTHDFECTWMHGKVFRKQYWIDNNIKFSEKLLYHEDSYILSNAFELTQKVDQIPAITYVWTFDDGSITRRNNGAYGWESIPEFIRAIHYSIDWLKDKVPDKIPSKVVQVSLYIYYMLQTNNWEKKWVDLIEDEIYNLLSAYSNEFNSLDRNIYSQLELQERIKVKDRAFVMTETFMSWANRVMASRMPQEAQEEVKEVKTEQ